MRMQFDGNIDRSNIHSKFSKQITSSQAASEYDRKAVEDRKARLLKMTGEGLQPECRRAFADEMLSIADHSQDKAVSRFVRTICPSYRVRRYVYGMATACFAKIKNEEFMVKTERFCTYKPHIFSGFELLSLDLWDNRRDDDPIDGRCEKLRNMLHAFERLWRGEPSSMSGAELDFYREIQKCAAEEHVRATKKMIREGEDGILERLFLHEILTLWSGFFGMDRVRAHVARQCENERCCSGG
jgi:hypothetical protein